MRLSMVLMVVYEAEENKVGLKCQLYKNEKAIDKNLISSFGIFACTFNTAPKFSSSTVKSHFRIRLWGKNNTCATSAKLYPALNNRPDDKTLKINSAECRMKTNSKLSVSVGKFDVWMPFVLFKLKVGIVKSWYVNKCLELMFRSSTSVRQEHEEDWKDLLPNHCFFTSGRFRLTVWWIMILKMKLVGQCVTSVLCNSWTCLGIDLSGT